MNWLAERPRPIAEAWNILCDAVWERLDFYGIRDLGAEFHRLPTVPCLKAPSLTMIDRMRAAIRELVQASFDMRLIGGWSTPGEWLDSGHEHFDDPRGSFWETFGADGHAFWGRAPSLPYRRHTFSRWVAAAAKVLNDAVRYPRCGFDMDFCEDGTLECDDFVTGNHTSARMSDGAILTVHNRFGTVIVNGSVIAVWERYCGRGRCLDHHWRYGGRTAVHGFSADYLTMPLTGEVSVRSAITLEHSEDRYPVARFAVGTRQFTLGTTAGAVSENFDLSAVSSAAAEIYRSDSESSPYSRAEITISHADRQLLITEANLQPLPYTYVE